MTADATDASNLSLIGIGVAWRRVFGSGNSIARISLPWKNGIRTEGHARIQARQALALPAALPPSPAVA
jgi:hypothetical protein